MQITHRGTTAVQDERNHHIMIFDESGAAAMHCTVERPLSENELKSTIDNYFLITGNIREKHPPKRNWKDAFMNTFLGRY